MKKLAFDFDKYIKVQRENINKRVKKYDNKLYIEFGGKLFDDMHASRVLPGFKPDSKLQMLLTMKDKIEIVIVVNARDIDSNKVRNDLGITYEAEVKRLIEAYNETELFVSSVVISFYQKSPLIDAFETQLVNQGINVYKHYKINGYPQNIPLIVSDEGLGKNEFVKTTRPIVVVTAPGPGSGKMATCLSQLYHELKNGVRAGYAKYETFPVWNLPLYHPVNLAYEAATVDLNDVNMIDPFHLEAYGKTTINYNRDIEVFPLLKAIFEKIYGSSPYQSPTDMGVNMVGFAIKDNDAAIQASKEEIVRRYFETLKYNFLGKSNDDAVSHMELIMKKAEVSPSDRKCSVACKKKFDECGVQCMAMELNNHKIVTGKRSELLTSSAALLLNALKVLGKIDDSIPLLSYNVIEPIINLKTGSLKNNHPQIHAEEILIALAIQAASNPLAEIALKQLPKLEGCEAHSSVILPDSDLRTFKKLGVHVTEEPRSYAHRLYKK